MQVITVNTKNIVKKSEQGFTLIELLVVIGILAILMGIVLIAINPARQFAQANNTDRSNAVTQILNAVGQYEADNHGGLPGTLTKGMAAPLEIAGPAVAGTSVDLCTPLSSTTQYIPSFPVDPSIDNGAGMGASVTDCTKAYDSGYKVQVDANGRVTITAPKTDLTVTANIISVTR